METLQKDAQALNTIGDYLAQRDVPEVNARTLQAALGAPQVDLLLLYGGSIPEGCRLAGELYQKGIARQMMISGGEGHTTDHLRMEMQRLYPDMRNAGRMESEVIAGYLGRAFEIPMADLILEKESTNCGENVIFTRRVLAARGEMPRTMLVIQDSTMQRRMDATFRKVWVEEPTRILHYAPYRAELVARDGALGFAPNDIWGFWSVERYVELLLGEMPRLTDDENGYGPKGKGFIAHVDIPGEVREAYQAVHSRYAGSVRKPWQASS